MAAFAYLVGMEFEGKISERFLDTAGRLVFLHTQYVIVASTLDQTHQHEGQQQAKRNFHCHAAAQNTKQCS